ncbi:MAG: hypothetical protein LBD04_06375 [Synergistaceae bacterium]|nr:hypothetical protein [Synergistaceae bacterium]
MWREVLCPVSVMAPDKPMMYCDDGVSENDVSGIDCVFSQRVSELLSDFWPVGSFLHKVFTVYIRLLVSYFLRMIMQAALRLEWEIGVVPRQLTNRERTFKVFSLWQVF